MTLMAEAARVIELRLQMIVFGRSTPSEMLLMVTEKIDAIEQAKAIIISGGDPSLVLDHYRKIVSANVVRLSGPAQGTSRLTFRLPVRGTKRHPGDFNRSSNE